MSRSSFDDDILPDRLAAQPKRGASPSHKTAAQATIATTANSTLTSVNVATVLLILALPPMLLGAVVLVVTVPTVLSLILLASVVLVGLVVFPVLAGIEELHRCRKLLEIVANRRGEP